MPRPTIFFLIVLLSIAASPTLRSEPRWPQDVEHFVERRELCDHFRGEMGSDDPTRNAEVNEALQRHCPDTDQTLADLKRKYAARDDIMAQLNGYETGIEPLPADVLRFIEQRNDCDHFRAEAGDAAFRAEYLERVARIDHELRRMCLGSDQALAALKRQYADRDNIMSILSGYEDRIEPDQW